MPNESRPVMTRPGSIALASLALAALLASGCATRHRWPGTEGEAHDVVNQSVIAIAGFRAHEGAPALQAALHGACAVLVFPRMVGTSLLAGASGGKGVLLLKDRAGDGWSGPAFVSLSEADATARDGLAGHELLVTLPSCGELEALRDAQAPLPLGALAGARSQAGDGVPGSLGRARAFAREPGGYAIVALGSPRLRLEPELARAYAGRPLGPGELFAPVLGGDRDSCEICRAIELTSR
jgi:lipid-binding SYLF domain-containing protein